MPVDYLVGIDLIRKHFSPDTIITITIIIYYYTTTTSTTTTTMTILPMYKS